MRSLQASLLYYIAVFGVGVVLGTIRVLLVAPLLDVRWAELFEQPLMLVASYYLARHAVRRFGPFAAARRLGIGVIALALMVGTELALTLFVQGLTLPQYLASRDPVSGAAYVLSLAAFALMPLLAGRGREIDRSSRPPAPQGRPDPEAWRKEIRMAAREIRGQALGLLGWVVLSFAASAIGAVASIQAKSFYGQLVQPSWAPPAAVFGPVWGVLYALMAIAAWLVWRRGGFRANRTALSLFVLQLALNALWSWLFFAWHLGAWAFADIVALWALVAATLACFWRVRRLAGALLVPYLLWVSFAAVLNYSVWRLNPQVLG